MIDPRSVDHIHYEHQCRYNQLAEKLEVVTKERDAAADYASDQAAVMELVAKALGVPDEPHQGRAGRILEAASSLAEERDTLRSALTEIANRIEGDLCQTVRDVINGLADANDVYDDADTLERIARGALKTEEPTE